MSFSEPLAIRKHDASFAVSDPRVKSCLRIIPIRWKSGRGLPQSKTLRGHRGRWELRQLLECASSLPLWQQARFGRRRIGMHQIEGEGRNPRRAAGWCGAVPVAARNHKVCQGAAATVCGWRHPSSSRDLSRALSAGGSEVTDCSSSINASRWLISSVVKTAATGAV